jgi:hypothetical protein
VTVSAGQRITASGTAAFGHTTTNAVLISASLCFSENTANAVPQPFHTDAFPDATIFPQPAKTSVSANGTRVMTVAGNYRVGFCVRNKSTTVNLTNNDYVNAWFMVTN